MNQGVADRVVLELANDGRPRLGVAGQPEVHEHAARAMAVEGALHLGGHHGERHGGVPGAVENGRDEALPAKASDRALPQGLAGLD